MAADQKEYVYFIEPNKLAFQQSGAVELSPAMRLTNFTDFGLRALGLLGQRSL
jgi:hypothetical protein